MRARIRDTGPVVHHMNRTNVSWRTQTRCRIPATAETTEPTRDAPDCMACLALGPDVTLVLNPAFDLETLKRLL